MCMSSGYKNDLCLGVWLVISPAVVVNFEMCEIAQPWEDYGFMVGLYRAIVFECHWSKALQYQFLGSRPPLDSFL